MQMSPVAKWKMFFYHGTLVLGCVFSKLFSPETFSKIRRLPGWETVKLSWQQWVNRGTDKKNESIFQQHNCAFIKLLRYSYYNMYVGPGLHKFVKHGPSCLIRREEDKPIRHQDNNWTMMKFRKKTTTLANKPTEHAINSWLILLELRNVNRCDAWTNVVFEASTKLSLAVGGLWWDDVAQLRVRGSTRP